MNTILTLFKNSKSLFERFWMLPLMFLLFSGNVFGQGNLGTPIFSENFGTITDGTAITTSNTNFSFVRVGTSTSGSIFNNHIRSKNPSSFTGSSGLISAKGGSISTVDKTSLASFTRGVLTYKFKTPSDLIGCTMLGAVGTGGTFGTASGFTGAQLSAGFQINGSNLQIRSSGAWTTVQTVSTSTSYTIAIVFNNTTTSTTYGSGTTLPANKCHLWINGNYVNEYNVATNNLASTAFRIYCTFSEFEVDDVAIYNALPTPSGFSVTFNGNGNTGGTMIDQTASVTTPLTANGFTRTNYAFAGWNTLANGTGTSYANGASYPFTANETLYAQWIPITTTLSNNGTPIAAGNITQGTNNTILASYILAQTGATTVLNEARFTTSGSYVAADINGNGFRLWYNTTNNFGTATQLGSLPSTAGGSSGDLLEFTGLTQALALGSTGYFWITANLSLSATVNNTILVDAMIGDDFIVSEGFRAGTASVSGTKTIIATVVPTLTVTPSTLTDFGAVCINTDSSVQSYNLSGINLTGIITVSAPSGFKVRKGVEAFASSTTLTPDGVNEVNSTIDVIYTPTVSGVSGSLIITHESAGAVTKNVNVSGTGSNGAVTINSVTPTAVTTTTASSGGTAVTTGCGTIDAKGVVWGTTISPTVPSANSTNEGGGTANYTSAITGLTENTFYYVRSYVINSNGITVHGSNTNLTTLSKAPTGASAETATTNGFTASWTAPASQGSAAFTYTVKIYSNNTLTTQVGAAITGITGTSTVISSLSQNTTYYYTVEAVNAGGSSAVADFTEGITTLESTFPWEDFEVGTKTGYASGNVTCTAGQWTMNNALLGTANDDRKNGLKSVRIQTLGFIHTNFDIATGVGTVKVQHAKYGTDAASDWRLVASTDGGTSWTAYESATVNTTLSSLTEQIFTVNLSGNVRLRIEKLTTSGRLNIDDIYITSFAACTPPANPIGIIEGTFTACATTTLSYSGADLATAYWQTSATGTSELEPVTSDKTVTLSGTYYVRNFASNCWSEASISQVVVINNTPVITTQPANASVLAGANTTFNVVATNVSSYQWQVDTGSGFTNLSNVAPYSNVTTATLNITGATLGMSGYLYRCVLTANAPCTNNTTNGLATLTVTNIAPNNGTNLAACIANDQISLSWTASTGTPPTGYIVFVQPNTTIPQMTAASAGNASGYSAITDYNLATSYTTLGKAVYKGNTTSATITGLTNASQYTFKVVAYIGESGTGWSNAINNTNTSSSYIKTYTIKVPEITNLAASINPTSSTVSWNVVPNSVGCYEYMVVANNGTVTLTPTGTGTAYTANTIFSSSNQVVYKGTGNSVIVTNLTVDVNYCYKVFVRELNSGNQWSDGTSICQTTALSYCTSQGTTPDATGITSVVFNTINQTSPSTNAYTDFTSVSTTVELGATHNLTVNVNTDTFRNYTRAWIDWNRDGDFNDSGESYDLGNAFNGLNELTSNSPLSITVPTNANIGNTRMRIATQYYDNTAPINIPINLTPCGTYQYGEVEDYTITISQPANAEINVKGGTISIPNGFDAPFGLNNTLFATTPLNTDSTEKEFTIENIGIADLILTGSPLIKIEGANPSDFIVTQQPTTPVLNGVAVTFKIKFNPTVAGLRTANVRIESNDGDENPYIFAIEGQGNCSISPTITVAPTTGPVNTLVSFSSSTNSLIGATVTYNNVNVAIDSVTDDKLTVYVPDGANDGNFLIQLATGCTIVQVFDLIDTNLTSCESDLGGGTDASDVIIYEVYDENGGSGGVITLFNRTGNSVNLSTYSIKRAGDYGGTYLTIGTLSGTLANGSLAVIGVSSSACGYTSTNNGNLGAAGFNGNDGFQLLKNNVLIDDVQAPDYVGYYLRRKNTNLNPNTTFNDSEWTTQSLTSNQCLTEVAITPVIQAPPIITVQPIETSYTCSTNAVSFTLAGTEGVPDGLPLAYQWYFNEPGSLGWTEASGTGITGVATATLNINNPAQYEGYQFYGQIRENTATCFTASQAVAIVGATGTITYSGGNWIGGLPNDITKNVVIEAGQTYNTSLGPIAARSLTNNGSITVDAANPVVIEFDLINNGNFNILNGGSLVQNCDVDNASTNNNVGAIAMQRISQPMYRLDYTYWSSPVSGNTLIALSPDTPANRFYHWNPTPGNWLVASGVMSAGKGYIVRAPNSHGTDATNPASYINFDGLFSGKPNNGTVSTPIVGASSGTDKWNLIGNPYPSAIDAGLFLDANVGQDSGNDVLGGTLYFWTHNAPFGAVNYAYSAGDYASWNSSGQTATNNGGLNDNNSAPSGYIAAGQGFFVQGTASGNAIFNNTMRVNGANLDFFKSAPQNASNSTNIIEKNRVWLNLQGATQGFSQTLVAYVTNATNGFDIRYDGPSFGGNQVTFYSVTPTENLSIQGRALPFSDVDEVPLGYKTTLTGNLIISIDHVDGLMENQGIYLKDNVLNVVHDLNASAYTFAAVPGTFNDRFVLRYLPDAVLDNPTFNEQINGVTIYKNNADLRINSHYDTIDEVLVYDITGRLVFEQKNCNTNAFQANHIVYSEQTLIVKVRLKNGGVVTKKVL